MSNTPKSPKKNTPKPKKNTPAPTPKRPVWWRFLWVFVLLFVGLWFLVCYVSIFAKTGVQARTLTVEKGDTYHSLLVAKKWQDSPLASSAAARAYLKFAAKKPLHAGVYRIPEGASLAETVKILEQGAEVAMVKLQIIEGKTIKDLYHAIKTTEGITPEILSPKKDGYSWADVTADNAKVAEVLGIDSPNGNLEGFFAPDTYYFAGGTSDTAVLKKLYEEQKKRLDDAWQSRDDGLPYANAYEMLIMASIIERETGVADERTKVAAVFVNRLEQGMRLQTDPTIIYGLFDRYDGTIYRSNINEKTDYNTYQIDGLPPTPIALPSAAAIAAAAHPDETDVLFFVATGKGGHTFSRTLAEHNQAVAAYRRVMSEKK
ncbi:MAG: endolytic transglycosylase MltG [Moraxella sp.]|nr:endolytic transglycosylase MltG [Moraxella sp.]